MKHIKLFENHNQYYTEIDNIEHVYENQVPFTNDEFITIHDEIISTQWKKIGISMLLPSGRISLIIIKPYASRGVVDSKSWKASQFSIYIWKLKDEWYYVESTLRKQGIGYDELKIYKCDQFDGLLKCLKDLKNKIDNEIYPNI